jgi:mycothiol synthase
MPPNPSIDRFVRDLEATTGRPVLSEAKMERLDDPDAITVVAEADDVLAIGVVAIHRQSDGSVHHAVETAVRPAMQFAEFERFVAEATLEAVPAGSSVSVWSDRSTLDWALGDIGLARVRTLLYLAVDLPLAESHVRAGIRTFDRLDVVDVVRVNNEAFRGHREAGSLTEERFAELEGASWFDPAGIVVAEDGSGLVGFCWTKVHPGGDGEIYRIAVAPSAHGQGWGRSLLVAAFAALADRDDVVRGTLWVDESNEAAMHLYDALGMRLARRTTEWEAAPGG